MWSRWYTKNYQWRYLRRVGELDSPKFIKIQLHWIKPVIHSGGMIVARSAQVVHKFIAHRNKSQFPDLVRPSLLLFSNQVHARSAF